MRCQQKYRWVKLPRDQMPPGKGIMGAWARLASRAAFRDGQAHYCRHTNQVTTGSWAGGMVGFKSFLGVKRRDQALKVAEELTRLGYIGFDLDDKTKKLTYMIKDWVVQCSGAPCMSSEAVYATPGYGFLCLPRDITQRLAEAHYQFDESDAWLDLWCHTVWRESGNAFSHVAPAVQFGRYGAVLTLGALGKRWGWEKTKVWRFFRKYADAFPLYKLPGSFGCLIFNARYPVDQTTSQPDSRLIMRILNEIRIAGGNTHPQACAGHDCLAKRTAWYSRRIVRRLLPPIHPPALPKSRVAVPYIYNTRAYFSLCGHYWNCGMDCLSAEGPPRSDYAYLPRDDPFPVPPTLTGGNDHGRSEGDSLWRTVQG